MQVRDRRDAGGAGRTAAEGAGPGEMGLHDFGVEARQGAPDRAPAERVPGAAAAHAQALDGGIRQQIQRFALAAADGKHRVPARRQRAAQIDEQPLAAAETARQHDLGDAHVPAFRLSGEAGAP